MMGNTHMFASPVRQDLRPGAHPGTSAGALVQNSLCTFPEAPVENQIRQSLITTFSSCARCIIHQQPFIRCWKKNKLAAQSDTDTRGEDGPGHPPYNTDDIGRRGCRGTNTIFSKSSYLCNKSAFNESLPPFVFNLSPPPLTFTLLVVLSITAILW